MSIQIRTLNATDVDAEMLRLVALLQDAVHSGSGLGFEPPLSDAEARAYWCSIRPELHAGSRILLGAYAGDRLIGTGQLQLAAWSAGRHRAELQKLFVDSAQRGRGVGVALVAALHEAALQRQRSLIILNTRSGQPAVRFYERLGYSEAGKIPDFARGPGGQSHTTVIFYRDLTRDVVAAGPAAR